MTNLYEMIRRDPVSHEAMLRLGIARARTIGSRQAVLRKLEVDLAYALIQQRRFREARQIVSDVLTYDAEHTEALWADAQLGFYLEEPWPGPWRRLDARWGVEYTGRPPALRRPWDGSSLVGKTVLLVGEGGLGDQIQFARFAPMLKQRGAVRVIVSVARRLVSLFRSVAGVDRVVANRDYFGGSCDLPEIDIDCALMSLPGLLGITPETLPADVPYLAVPEEAAERARSFVSQRGGPINVGLFWHANEADRRMRLEEFALLASIRGVRLFALGDRGVIAEELERCSFPMVDLASEKPDLVSTAAAVTALDLVISVDSLGAHLAGSLGRPVWTILREVADWRWPVDGDTTPWYPTMRIFRECIAQDEPAIPHIARALEELAGGLGQ